MPHDPNSTAPRAPRPESTDPPPTKKRRLWLWVFGIVFGGGFLCLLICCGAGAYVVQNYGSTIFEPARNELNQTADIREEIGTIESLNMNFFATVDEQKSNPDFLVLDGKSENGPFQVSVKMENSGELEKAFLVMPDGGRKPIDLRRFATSPAGASEQETSELEDGLE